MPFRMVNAIVNAIVEIDKAGRIVMPKKMRDALHLHQARAFASSASSTRFIWSQTCPSPMSKCATGFR